MMLKKLSAILIVFIYSCQLVTGAVDPLSLPSGAKEVFSFEGKVLMNGKSYTFEKFRGMAKPQSYNELTGYMIPSGELLAGDHSRQHYPQQAVVVRGHFTKADVMTRHSSKGYIGGSSPFKIKKGKIHIMHTLPDEDDKPKRGHGFKSDLPEDELTTIVISYDVDTCWVAYGNELVKFIDPATLDDQMEFITLGYGDKGKDYITDFVFYNRSLLPEEMGMIVGCDNPKLVDLNNYDYSEDDNVRLYMIYLVIGLVLTIIYFVLTVKWWGKLGVGLYPLWLVVWSVIAMIVVFNFMFHGPMIRIQCTTAAIALLFYMFMCLTPYRYKSEEDKQLSRAKRKSAIVTIVSTLVMSIFNSIIGVFSAFYSSQRVEKTYVNGQLRDTRQTTDMGSFVGKLITTFIGLVFPFVLAAMLFWFFGNILMNLIYFVPMVQFFVGLSDWSDAKKGA